MIIGISGKAGSGKDTVAQIIQFLNFQESFPEIHTTFVNRPLPSHKLYGKKWKIRKFAHAVKEVASLLTRIPVSDFEKSEVKAMSLGEHWGNMTVRDILQKIGTDAIRNNVHENAWVNALMSQYHEGDNWIITDVRFPNEANAIKERGGVLIRLNRQSNVLINANHSSETALDDYEGFDFCLDNTGTIDDLIESVKDVMKIINANHENKEVV